MRSLLRYSCRFISTQTAMKGKSINTESLMKDITSFENTRSKTQFDILDKLISEIPPTPRQLSKLFVPIIRQFSIHGDMASAEGIWNSLEKHSVSLNKDIVSSMISGYGIIGNMEMARYWYNKCTSTYFMNASHYQYAMVDLLNATLKNEPSYKVMELIDFIKKEWKFMDKMLLEGIIECYLTMGQIDKAIEEYNEFIQHGYTPSNKFLWLYFQVMIRNKKEIDPKQFELLPRIYRDHLDGLKIYCTGDFPKLRQYLTFKFISRLQNFDYIRQLRGSDSAACWIQLIDKKFPIQRLLSYSKSSLDSNMGTALLLIHLKQNNYTQAIFLMERLIAQGSFPNRNFYYMLFEKLLAKGKYDKAEIILKNISKSLVMDRRSFIPFLKTYSQIPDRERMENIIKLMNRDRVQQTSETYGYMMTCFYKLQLLSTIDNIVKVLDSKNISLNRNGYTYLLKRYAIENNIEKVNEIWEKMENSPYPPNRLTYKGLLEAYCDGEHYNSLFQLAIQLKKDGENFDFEEVQLLAKVYSLNKDIQDSDLGKEYHSLFNNYTPENINIPNSKKYSVAKFRSMYPISVLEKE